MTLKKTQPDTAKLDRIVAEARKYIDQREKGYREQALKLYPWICGRCSREFTHTNLRELTVHHKDHNHDNNPPNGSNWELLCHYCHDNEHMKYEEAIQYGNTSQNKRQSASSTHNPFADLKAMLKGTNE